MIKEINQNEVTSKKHEKVCAVLTYFEHLVILHYAVTGCLSIYALAALVETPIEIMSSAVAIKICTITTGIKKYQSVIKKKKEKKHDKIVLLAKTKLNHRFLNF